MQLRGSMEDFVNLRCDKCDLWISKVYFADFQAIFCGLQMCNLWTCTMSLAPSCHPQKKIGQVLALRVSWIKWMVHCCTSVPQQRHSPACDLRSFLHGQQYVDLNIDILCVQQSLTGIAVHTQKAVAMRSLSRWLLQFCNLFDGSP